VESLVETLEHRQLLAVFFVTSNADSGANTLRDAINQANALAGNDLIHFNLSSPTIRPLSALPAVTDSLLIDGITQPGFAGNPLVVIDGKQAGNSSGLRLDGADNTVIRGLVINNFRGHGISLLNSADVSIQNNNIGTNSAGTKSIPNGGDGIRVGAGSSGLSIVSNTIANNKGSGVNVLSGLGHTIVANRISGNGGIGIDLAPAGATANDSRDADTGPNNLQNFPVINSAVNDGIDLTLAGSFRSVANQTFEIHIYANNSANEQAGIPVGFTTVTTNADGKANFTLANRLLEGDEILRGASVVATATLVGGANPSLDGSTSELSPARKITSRPYRASGRNVVIAPDAGFFGPFVLVRDAANPDKILHDFLVADSSFHGGVRVASGDVNGDGFDDIVTGLGFGGLPTVRVFDGKSGEPLPGKLGNFLAFPRTFTSSVFVAAGDVNGDGKADIITTTGGGTVPQVRVFNGRNGALLSSFLAFDSKFANGVHVAAGDVNGDGKAEVIVAGGPGSAPQVRVFNPLTRKPLPGKLGGFFAFEKTMTNGVFVAAGDINGDNKADILTSPVTGEPRVQVYSGKNGARLVNALAFDPTFLGGVRVAAVDLDGDGKDEILAAPGGPGLSNPEVLEYDSKTRQFEGLFPSFFGGVFVG
jgi:hypothetical protein